MNHPKAFDIQERNGAGRAMISKKVLGPQAMVLAEKPVWLSPHLSLFALNCPQNICSRCFIVLPSTEPAFCSTCTLDQRVEKFRDTGQSPLQATICLQVLGLAEARRRKGKNVASLMSRRDPRPRPNEVQIVQSILDVGTNPRIKASHIEDALGVLSINGVKVQRGTDFVPCVALYPTFSMANHSCLSNCQYAFDPDTFEIQLRSRHVIPRNRELTITYMSPMMTTQERARATASKWDFSCMCSRCCDSSEMGSFLSAIRCPHCGPGGLEAMLALEPRSPDSIWRCGTCGFEMSSSEVELSLKNVSEQIEDASNSHQLPVRDVINALEHALWQASHTLHGNHAWILNLEYRLIHHLAAICRERGPKSQRIFWERRLQMGRHLLEVVSRVDPGLTKWRGMVLQDMVIALMELSKRDVQCGGISKTIFKQRVQMAMRATNEAFLCLRFEPRNVQEPPLVEPKSP